MRLRVAQQSVTFADDRAILFVKNQTANDANNEENEQKII